jgi:hypothetical protein
MILRRDVRRASGNRADPVRQILFSPFQTSGNIISESHRKSALGTYFCSRRQFKRRSAFTPVFHVFHESFNPPINIYRSYFILNNKYLTFYYTLDIYYITIMILQPTGESQPFFENYGKFYRFFEKNRNVHPLAG